MRVSGPGAGELSGEFCFSLKKKTGPGEFQIARKGRQPRRPETSSGQARWGGSGARAPQRLDVKGTTWRSDREGAGRGRGVPSVAGSLGRRVTGPQRPSPSGSPRQPISGGGGRQSGSGEREPK